MRTCLFKLSLSLVCFCLYFILSQAVNIGLDPKEIRDEIPAVNLTKNLASRRQSWRDSRQDRAEIFATVNLLLGEKLGEIRGRIPARF